MGQHLSDFGGARLADRRLICYTEQVGPKAITFFGGLLIIYGLHIVNFISSARKPEWYRIKPCVAATHQLAGRHHDHQPPAGGLLHTPSGPDRQAGAAPFYIWPTVSHLERRIYRIMHVQASTLYMC